MEKINLEKFIFISISFSTIFILIYNFFHYSPLLGYDAEAHYDYVNYFSMYLPDTFNLPSNKDSREFFNPPLAYLFPSLIQVACRNIIKSTDLLSECQSIYGKFTMLFQYLLYLLTLIVNMKSIQKILNIKSYKITSYLLLISMLAVNYRTISMITGEPYILFFLSLFIYSLILASKKGFDVNYKYFLFTGLLIGLLALSRQWGFLLFPALGLLIFDKSIKNRKKYFSFITYSFFIGFIVSSWFYINLYLKYGSFTKFNKDSLGFNLTNKPTNFYFPSMEHLEILFTNPIRPYLNNQFLTTLYADLWGDYWGFFSFTSKYLNIGRNQLSIGSYLGNVNKLAVFSTFIILLFYILSNRNNKGEFVVKYVSFSVLFSLFGYLWFVISYPESTGDTVKASYMIQIFHLIVFSASLYFESIKSKNKKLYNSLLATLFIIYLYNFQTYLSHFPEEFILNF
jgi:hypothetical protein